jgi:hypothetical protein
MDVMKTAKAVIPAAALRDAHTAHHIIAAHTASDTAGAAWFVVSLSRAGSERWRTWRCSGTASFRVAGRWPPCRPRRADDDRRAAQPHTSDQPWTTRSIATGLGLRRAAR